ncbi:cystathionine beta-synthase [Aethina tumida]|uniref:cystathionine beta-synthase n=1 Tax=Aethina tumida TaxID=116153 RepID=UPI00096AF7FE|nr:cystathionine beta-synthase [Aethina tumida]
MGFLPNKKSRCTWTRYADPSTSPHTKSEWPPKRNKVCDNILDAIGNTPLVKLNKIPQSEGLKCEVYAKCEFMNPGFSIKDRVALRAITDGEIDGTLTTDSIIVEPSSGNTGVAIALVATIKGYNCTIVMPKKTSPEKVALIKALGGQIAFTPNNVNIDSEDSIFGRTQKILQENQEAVTIDQFSNASNPLAHYDLTAEEIWEALDGDVHMVVCGCGTGGTITGIGRKLKERNEEITIIAVDPLASDMARPEYLNRGSITTSEIEGIGFKSLTPTNLDRSVIDKWVKVSDKEAFVMARRLAKEEGIFGGGTSGANLSACLNVAKEFDETKKVVVIFPDSIKYYLTRFVQDPWMEIRQYQLCVNKQKTWWWNFSLKNMHMSPVTSLKSTTSCHRVLHEFRKQMSNFISIVNEEGHCLGVASRYLLEIDLILEKIKETDPIEMTMLTVDIPKVPDNTTLGVVSRALELSDYCLVCKKIYQPNGSYIEIPISMLTPFDVVHYLANHPDITKYGAI